MTPRPEVDWVDLDQELPVVLERLRVSPHSRLPAARGGIDAAVGVLHAKDVLASGDGRRRRGDSTSRHWSTRRPRSTTTRTRWTRSRRCAHPPVGMAFVVDEHGTFEGLVTAADLLEAIAGQFAAAEHQPGYRTSGVITVAGPPDIVLVASVGYFARPWSSSPSCSTSWHGCAAQARLLWVRFDMGQAPLADESYWNANWQRERDLPRNVDPNDSRLRAGPARALPAMGRRVRVRQLAVRSDRHRRPAHRQGAGPAAAQAGDQTMRRCATVW